MSRTHKDSRHYKAKARHLSVRAVRRNPPDLRKLSRALIALAMAEAAAEADAKAPIGKADANTATPHVNEARDD